MISGYLNITIVPIVNILHVGTLYQGRFFFTGLNDFLATIHVNSESLFQNNTRFKVQPAFNTDYSKRVSNREDFTHLQKKQKHR